MPSTCVRCWPRSLCRQSSFTATATASLPPKKAVFWPRRYPAPDSSHSPAPITFFWRRNLPGKFSAKSWHRSLAVKPDTTKRLFVLEVPRLLELLVLSLEPAKDVQRFSAQACDANRTHHIRPAVETDVAIVAHHEQFPRRYFQGAKIVHVRLSTAGVDHIRLGNGLSVNENDAVTPFDGLTRHGDQPLHDVESVRIQVDDDISVLGCCLVVVPAIHSDAA